MGDASNMHVGREWNVIQSKKTPGSCLNDNIIDRSIVCGETDEVDIRKR
jgi:hypothetical protein